MVPASTFAVFDLPLLPKRHNLFIQQHRPPHQDSVAVVMPQKPIVKRIPFLDFFGEIGQPVGLISAAADDVCDAAGAAVDNDIIQLSTAGIQIAPGYFIFFGTGRFFFPPRNMVNVVKHAASIQLLPFAVKTRATRLQNARTNIMRGGSARISRRC